MAHAQKSRERDLGLPIGGTPGALDAITDVAGVEVGHTTLIAGEGPLVVGTVGTRVDGEEIKTALTTPEAPDLHGRTPRWPATTCW